MGCFVDHFNADCLPEMFTKWWQVGRHGLILESGTFFEIVNLKRKKLNLALQEVTVLLL